MYLYHFKIIKSLTPIMMMEEENNKKLGKKIHDNKGVFNDKGHNDTRDSWV